MKTFLDSFRHTTPVYLGDRAYVYLRRYILQEIQERHKVNLLAIIGDQAISRLSETAIKVEECLRSRIKELSTGLNESDSSKIARLDNLLLILHTPGGELDETRKIVEVIRAYCPTNFRVIVPSYAKSAGTFIFTNPVPGL